MSVKMLTHRNCLGPSQVVSGLDHCTVTLHSPNGRHLPAIRDVQGDCQWSLKNDDNSHRSCEFTMHCMWGVPQSIFGSINHTADKTANWRPCRLFHWQSHCHHVRTVKQSVSRVLHQQYIALLLLLPWDSSYLYRFNLPWTPFIKMD